ncbi:MAG: hypothetical protein R3E58_16580 [Phycisphaerae bacterium]
MTAIGPNLIKWEVGSHPLEKSDRSGCSGFCRTQTREVGVGDALSREEFGVDLFIEADQDGFAFANRRGSQIAGRTEHRGDGFVQGFGASFEVEPRDLCSLGYDDLAGFFGQIASVIAAQFLFPGVRLLCCGEMVLRKEPLRFGATCSVAAVVVPIDGLGHF